MYVLIKIKLKNSEMIINNEILINGYVKNWMDETIENNYMIKSLIENYTIEVKL